MCLGISKFFYFDLYQERLTGYQSRAIPSSFQRRLLNYKIPSDHSRFGLNVVYMWLQNLPEKFGLVLILLLLIDFIKYGLPGTLPIPDI